MARRQSHTEQSLPVGGAAEPRVHTPGRLSDDGSAAAAPASSGASTSAAAGVDQQPSAGGTEQEQQQEQEREREREQEAARLIAEQARQRQRQRRKLLHDCEHLLLLDFDTLAIPHWPDHHALSLARRRRDSWVLGLAVLSAVVLAGMADLVPAVIAGVSFGLLVLSCAWGLPVVRHIFTSEPSYMELLLKRRQLLHRARKHVQHLEGSLGLAACCRQMTEYNSALGRRRFQRLYRLSEQGRLAGSIRSRGAAQLYLIFALEAEKAYNRLREAYLNEYQNQLEQGDAPPLDAASEASAEAAEVTDLVDPEETRSGTSPGAEVEAEPQTNPQPTKHDDDVSRDGAS